MSVLGHLADSAGGASDGLLASSIAGFSTVLVACVGIFATRTRRRSTIEEEENEGHHTSSDPIIRAEIDDLKAQRRALQTKNTEQAAEIIRLQNLCWMHNLNPHTGEGRVS